MPKVSIITPCYNSATFVGETIESVHAQTFTDWEHIIVDDGSTDGSAEVICACAAEDSRLQIVRKGNGGVASARNAGFYACAPDSRYLLFLDADDCLKPGMVAFCVNYMDRLDDVGMVHCGMQYIDAEGGALPSEDIHTANLPRWVPSGLGVRALHAEEVETPFVSIFCLAGIVPSLCVLRRAVYAQTPGWDEDFGQHYEDTNLFLHMAIRARVHFLPAKLVYYRRHAAQNTATSVSKQAVFAVQEQKLYSQWKDLPGLTPQQQKIVRQAQRFREGRLLPKSGVLTGTRHLRRREWKPAVRFYGGAIRRYAASFLPAYPVYHRTPTSAQK